MRLGEIGEKERKAYLEACEKAKWMRDKNPAKDSFVILATALRDQLAARLKLEFRLQYAQDEGYDLEMDERHEWTDDDWRAEAERMLRGEK